MCAHQPALNRQSASPLPPTPEELFLSFIETVPQLDQITDKAWMNSDFGDTVELSDSAKQLLTETFAPVQEYLESAFWDFTASQLEGETTDDIAPPLTSFWDVYITFYERFSRFAPIFDRAGLHPSIVGMRNRIRDRAERLSQPYEDEEPDEELDAIRSEDSLDSLLEEAERLADF